VARLEVFGTADHLSLLRNGIYCIMQAKKDWEFVSNMISGSDW